MSKFYQLEPDEWLEACKILKPAELKVLYRLRTLDPFGDRPIKFRVIDIAKDLDMNKGTVSRAVQVLGEQGYINVEIVEAIATLTTKTKKLPVENIQEKLCTDNSVVYRQQKGQKKLCGDHPSCVQTTSAIATQPDSPQTLTQQSTDFSHTIKTNNTDQIRSKDENFELKNYEVEAKVNQEISIQETSDDDPEKDFKDFIIKTIERDRKITIANREAYLSKVLAKDRNHWRSLYEMSKRPKVKARDVITEDIWRFEQSLIQAINNRDYEFAIARLEIVPEMKDLIFAKHPEWRNLLCIG
jgi:predicted DNA-binding transcriptional regulator